MQPPAGTAAPFAAAASQSSLAVLLLSALTAFVYAYIIATPYIVYWLAIDLPRSIRLVASGESSRPLLAYAWGTPLVALLICAAGFLVNALYVRPRLNPSNAPYVLIGCLSAFALALAVTFLSARRRRQLLRGYYERLYDRFALPDMEEALRRVRALAAESSMARLSLYARADADGLRELIPGCRLDADTIHYIIDREIRRRKSLSKSGA